MSISGDNLKLLLVFGLSNLLIIGGLWYWYQLDQPEPIELELAADAATSSAMIWVDVQGAVNQPGVFSLPKDSRVKDAVIAAGGVTAQADRDYLARTLNLAAPLNDGAKIYIPAVSDNLSQTNESKGVISGVTSSSLVNVNSASASELEALSGIGPARAEAIIKGRPYQRLEELTEKKILSESLFGKIKDSLSLY